MTNLEKTAAKIREAETYVDQHSELDVSCHYHLAHARKEWGHASLVPIDKPELQEYYLNIVRRDLAWFWRDGVLRENAQLTI